MANTRNPLTVGRKLLKMLLPPLNNLPLQPGHRHAVATALFSGRKVVSALETGEIGLLELMI